MAYEERFYRRISNPEDLVAYEVKYKESDLFCCTKTDLSAYIRERLIFYRNQIEKYIKHNPFFKDSLSPIAYDPLAPSIVKRMLECSQKIGVGPMASVAGAIAEYIGEDIHGLSDEFIIENGGDIYLRTKRERIVLIYAKDSPLSQRIGLKIKASDDPYGICTSSGTFGHSLSFGKADAVCIVTRSAAMSDGLATYIGNLVKTKDSIPYAIEVAKRFEEILGIVVIVGKHMGVWGDIELKAT
ncbi:MAG: UPF0280 family protein [Desulfobacterota bacterium]|nr:UPF0280 family protein [Thermodesulfobacteriota bacterium]MDW8001220.1 UPF0280 family protein [Deltaproteobacteria bacterium]